MKRLGLVVCALIVAFLTSAVAAQDASKEANLGAIATILELKPYLKPYSPPSSARRDGAWYTFTAVNLTDRAIARVLQAGQPPSSGLTVIPSAQRPAILQVASANPGVLIQPANEYGRKSFKVTIPASAKISLAVRLVGASDTPSLLVWSPEPLSAHNKNLAIFIAAVAGLIGAAAAIAGGLGVMTHHWAPRWAAASLTSMLLMRLAATGVFDGSIVTSIGGPYGLIALFGGLTLAAGIRFVDLVVPLREMWPRADRWVTRGVAVLLGVSALAYVGLPGATLATDILLFCGPLAIFAYLLLRQKRGSQPARILVPAGGLFAMTSVATAFAALGGFGNAALTPDFAGGFAAAGAILLALAVTAGEGITVIPWRHSHPAMAPVAPRPQAAPPPPPPSTEPHPALEAIGASHQGMFELDLVHDGAILSAEAAALFGMRPSRIAHSDWINRIHQDDRPIYEQAIAEFGKQSGLAFRIEFRVRSENRRYPWCELRATMKGPDGLPAERCVGLLADVTMRKEAEAEMIDRSVRDPLTGLGNRVALMEELEGLGGRLKDILFAVLDIDRFKSIHASLGDSGGDAVLTQLAERLVQTNAGQVFRIGGDGFAVLMNSQSGKAAEIGAMLVRTCSTPHQCNGRSVFAPVSVGLAFGGQSRDPIDLLKNAELALMEAKRQGGDCARVYAPEMEALAPRDAVALESELRDALDRGQIEVFYQPIVRLSDRTVAGFEALLRWRHPKKGLVSPSDFITHSEESGVIVALGELVLGRAVRELAQWQRYFPLSEPLFVSVNVARRQLRDAAELDRLSALISQAGVAPGSVKIELTESIIAADADAKELAARVKGLGAGLSIDDFGTGMSSLSQLADLPFDTVKIDKSFLGRNGGTDAEANGDVVLSSIISLAHELQRNVIVEGVETEADAEKIAELGCEFAQGFLFSEPVTAHDALTYIARTFRAAGERMSGATGVGGQA